MTQQTIYIQGMVCNEETRCTMADLCRLCGVDAELIHSMIDEGILSPEGRSPGEWSFPFVAVKRVRTVLRLHRDLRVNMPGCALALDLLEELEELRRFARRR
ncbi:MAG: chaperone modulator CbpM [Desulfobulbus sp.]|jgi:chaperone modulatory protein CbpM